MTDATAANKTEKLQFQTEAQQLLNLMIHSLYSHKEVFLRELVSNASDALDKVRFEALTNKDIDTGELAVRIKPDKTARTLTISDNGIGMSRQEVIDNIGTIARSGSKAFLERLTGDQKADSNLIGQFGVGFYSVFMVASRVKIVTKRAGSDEPAVVWESDGVSDYTIGETTKEGHGTDVTVYLNDENGSYAEDWQVRSVIKKYSDFIAFPIYLPTDKGKDEIVNETKPIWKRKQSEVTQEQYNQFYTQALGGFDEPLATIHVAAEGTLEYYMLLFVPSKPPFDLFGYERKHGVKLYVKRVFIMDDCKELVPEYLRFVRGVVDSEDLPLNVSREMLQQNAVITKIRKALVSKVLGRLKEIAESEPGTYNSFWSEFGPVLKEGLHMDFENREQLLELVRFQSSNGATKSDLTSLKQYVERMRDNQKDIYYITGESREIVEKSPHLEVFRDKGIEVLYLVDAIDEFIVHDIGSFNDKKLVSVTKGDLDLGELGAEEKKERKQAESKLKKLAERIKNILADSVKEVRVTTRLRDSASCLVSDEHEMGAHMEKLMKAMNREFTPAKRTLEINGTHPIVLNMNALYEKDPKDARLGDWAHLLYEQALVSEGQPLPDPAAYTRRVNDLFVRVSSEAAGGTHTQSAPEE